MTQETKPKIVVDTFVDPEVIQTDLSVNLVDLDACFIKQASLFAHYAGVTAKAMAQMDGLKLSLDVKEAQINTLHRDSLSAAGKVTEAMITNAVLVDKRYVQARRLYNESKMVYEMLKGVTEAFRQRRDMLIQVGTNQREERKGEVSLAGKYEAEVATRSRTRKLPTANEA